MLPAASRQFGRAWLALTLALAAHGADEALTDFLSVYNPLVRAAREPALLLGAPVWLFREAAAQPLIG